MASRRMISQRIILSARFIKMPPSARLLYYDLNMAADDDGVVEAFSVVQMTNSSEDDLKVLAAKGFVKVLNGDLVTYIMDWTEHNMIRADRKVNSAYRQLLLEIVPEAEIVEPKPRSDVQDNSRRLGFAYEPLVPDEFIDAYPAVNVQFEWERMIDWLRSHGQTPTDMKARFRNWLKNEIPKKQSTGFREL